MHLHNCRCFQEHLRMLWQSLKALCLAPGGPGSIWNYLGAPVRPTGVSRRFACGFRTDLHFADVWMYQYSWMPSASTRVNSHLRPYELSLSPAIRNISVSGHTRHLHLRPYKTSPFPAIQDIFVSGYTKRPRLRLYKSSSSPAETCVCNTPPLVIHCRARNKRIKQSDSHTSLLKTLREWAGKEYCRSLRMAIH